MKNFLLFVLMACNLFTFGQRSDHVQILNEKSIKQWYGLSQAAITNDGLTVFYNVNNQPIGTNTIYVRSLLTKKAVKIIAGNQMQFTGDSRYLIYCLYDTIMQLDLSSFKSSAIVRAVNYMLADNRKVSWIIYRPQNSKALVFKNLTKNSEDLYPEADSYIISSDHTKAIIITIGHDKNSNQEVIYKNLLTGTGRRIAVANRISNGVFSKSGKLFLYKCEDQYGKSSLRYINFKDFTVRDLAIEKVLKRNKLKLSENLALGFSVSDSFIFLNTERTEVEKVNSRPPFIWSFNDTIQGYDRELSTYTSNYLQKKLRVAWDIGRASIRMVELEGEQSFSYSLTDFLLIAPLPNSQAVYNSNYWPYLDILDLKTGERSRIIPPKYTRYMAEQISPNGKFVLWFDTEQRKWFSHDIVKKVTREIAPGLDTVLYDKKSWDTSKRIGVWGVAGWTHDNSVLLYDAYDIWKIPLSSAERPVNITGGYGRQNQIVLSLVSLENSSKIFDLKKDLLVRQFDSETKSGGYCMFNAMKRSGFNRAQLQQYSVPSRTPLFFHSGADDKIIKAKDSRNYLVLRESAEISCNVYLTSDFLKYKKISDISPEKHFQWHIAELIKWKGLDGTGLSGILYKPKNLDSSKKYPVIFNYYESRTDELHKYLQPDFSRDNINIPLFVAHGYMVFVPDIISKSGLNGEGSFSAIESAAMVLAKIPYIDSAKFALQGHSYGGWQTNYLITRSNRFVAACEVAGVSNQISAYSSINYKGTSRIKLYETSGQGSAYGIGRTPWTDIHLYLSNSPVVNIGNISTPLLMVHNRDDTQVPFNQAIEMYVGMQRAGKKVWLLQYDDGYGHNFGRDDVAASDFHTKMLQFFGYYLKGAPKPNWMEGLSKK